MAEIHPVLRNRTSGIAFSGKPPTSEQLETMLEAFRWGPSSANKQPWRILVVRSPEAHKKFDDALSDNNKKWATEAPVKMVIIGNPEEQPPRFGQDRWLLDVGLALENMLIQGCELGLTAHAMAGWDEEKVRANFDIPDPYRVAALFGVGEPGKVEDLSEEMQTKANRPSVRKPAEEIFFFDEFGAPGKP
jgi:nitroreductase